MSLVTSIDSLAQRTAQEFNAVRGEIADLATLSNVDGGAPGSVFGGVSGLNGGSP